MSIWYDIEDIDELSFSDDREEVHIRYKCSDQGNHYVSVPFAFLEPFVTNERIEQAKEENALLVDEVERQKGLFNEEKNYHQRTANHLLDANDKLKEGRHYLMGVGPIDLTVEDCLEAFGFGRNGLGG